MSEDLKRKIEAKRLLAEKQGLEMYGYRVDDLGEVRAMTRAKGLGRKLERALDQGRPDRKRGVAVEFPSEPQGSLFS